MTFIGHVYTASAKYPRLEQYGLIDQIRRAAVSIALNIAEGAGAGSDKEFARFLQISFRSIYEVITAAEVAILLGYGLKVDQENIIRESDELAAMIVGFMKTLRS